MVPMSASIRTLIIFSCKPQTVETGGGVGGETIRSGAVDGAEHGMSGADRTAAQRKRHHATAARRNTVSSHFSVSQNVCEVYRYGM